MGRIVRGVLAIGAIVAGVITANPGLILAGVSIGASALRPKPPRNSPENLNRLRANVDPLTARKTFIGGGAAATDIRDEEFTNDQEFFHRFIVCASHKVHSIDEIWFDDKRVWTATGGVEGDAVGYLTVATRTEGSAANAINISPRMGNTRRYTGLAYVHLRYKLTGNDKKTDSPFAQSIPTRITIRGRGALLPDPRNPAHDMSDQSTWTWNENACRNPALALLFYLLGWRINGKLAVGKGIPADRIDLDSFITAANICDELVPAVGGGTEPRYRCDGVWSEGDSPTTVIDMLKACMNADLDDVGGRLRLTVFHNDLATPVADFGDNDIIDAFSWQPLPPLDQTFNVVRGLYTDPSDNSLYQQVDYPEQRLASPDDIDRIDTFNLPMVQSPGQAQRLAQLRLQRQRFAGEFRAEFQANAWKVTKNSVIRLTFGQTGFVQKFFRVAEIEIRQDGRVPLVLREEDPAIYGDPPLTGPISPIFSTPFDPARSPFVQAINRWRGQWSSTETYVLDDLVTGSDTAGWRYINATPSAGNPLPVWPATANAFWQNFTPPGGNGITINPDGEIEGIGSGSGTPVDNRGVALEGVENARPGGAFPGQLFIATDTGNAFRWDGTAWEIASDVTATAQRSIVPQFPIIEIRQGEAGNVGNRVILHSARRGTETLLAGVWSIPSQLLGAGTATVNASTGAVTLSGIMQSGSYTIRYTHTDGVATELKVNVTFIPAPVLPGSATASGAILNFSGATLAQISPNLEITLPSGVTSATLAATNVDLELIPEGPAGSTTVLFQWQRETSPGTWADVGASATSSPSPSTFDTGLLDGGGNPVFEGVPGLITISRSVTGLSAGSTQRFRLMGRISAGNVRFVIVSGTAVASA